MTTSIDRRRFVQTSGLFLAAAAAPSLMSQPAAVAAPAGHIKKALCFEMIQAKGASAEDKLRIAKDAGFNGVEINCQRPKKGGLDPKVLARASEKLGVPVHGVSGAAGDLPAAIEEAAIYGATTVLHVARADAKAPYLETYRKAQDTIRAAVPTAEKHKITILVENVWATFLIEPMMMARFVDEINNPFVKCYFDVGNVMRWGQPQGGHEGRDDQGFRFPHRQRRHRLGQGERATQSHRLQQLGHRRSARRRPGPPRRRRRPDGQRPEVLVYAYQFSRL
jgi:hypothetical protein